MKLAEILILVEHLKAEVSFYESLRFKRMEIKHALLPTELDAEHPIRNLLSDNGIQIVNKEVEYRVDSTFGYCSIVVAQDPAARHEGKFPVYENNFGGMYDIHRVIRLRNGWSSAGFLDINHHDVSDPMDSVVHVDKLLASGVCTNMDSDNCSENYDVRGEWKLPNVRVPVLGSGRGCFLYYGIFRGYIPLCEALLRSKLLESGGFSESPKDSGWIKLHVKIALSSGNIKVLIEVFMKLGIDIGKYIISIEYALQSAANCGQLDIVKFLLDNGVDVNQSGPQQKSALHFSCSSVVGKYLLEKGANVNQEAALHRPPLHDAIKRGDLELVKLLLLHRANPHAIFEVDGIYRSHMVDGVSTCEKCNCAVMAVLDGYKSISTILIRFGARSNMETLVVNVFNRGVPVGAPRFSSTVAQASLFEDVQVYLDHNFSDFTTPWRLGPLHKFHDWNMRFPININFGKRGTDLQDTLIEYRDFVPVFAKHIIKIEAAFSSTAPKEMRAFCTDLQLHDFERNCREEVAVMRRECIPHTSVPFHDILTGNTEDLSVLFRNENAVECLKEMDIRARFPLYSGVLRCRISDGLWRKRILDDAMKLFCFLFKPHFAALPQEMRGSIVRMLSNQDVLVLEACFNDDQLKAIVGYPNCSALLESPFP